MSTTEATQPQNQFQTLNIRKEVDIDAPVAITFESILEEIGPGSVLEDGTPFHMKLEPFPGGRWFRDLGNNTGHLWGHVQVIKPPTLLELCGPMFMSYPATNFIQYRLAARGKATLLTFTHHAMGLIPEKDLVGVHSGWAHAVRRIQEIARGKVARA